MISECHHRKIVSEASRVVQRQLVEQLGDGRCETGVQSVS